MPNAIETFILFTICTGLAIAGLVVLLYPIAIVIVMIKDIQQKRTTRIHK